MDNFLNYSLNENPLTTFLAWYEEASKVEQNAQAMAVSTIDQTKLRPNTRYLLFKGVQDQKIIFYSNYSSAKGKELDLNPEITLAFYWHESKKQVRIHGRVTKMNHADSVAYFHSRDRDSQIASAISSQSTPVVDKKSLTDKFNAAKAKYEGQEVPMPDHWGGYLVEPYEYEFFLYGENRLNDRFQYIQKNNKWEVTRLEP